MVSKFKNSKSVKLKLEIMAVLKVFEVLSNSDKSWEDATKKAVKEASKSVKTFVLFTFKIKVPSLIMVK